jgi:hypothetical protein
LGPFALERGGAQQESIADAHLTASFAGSLRLGTTRLRKTAE